MNRIGIFLLSGITFLLPIQPLILVVVLMVFLDTLSGVYATIKIDGRQSFRSGKLFNIVPKIIFYSTSIILSFMIDKFIFGGVLFSIPFFLSKAASVLWIYIEGKSIDENSQKLGNRPILDIVKKLIGGLKNIKKDINELK